MGGRIVSACAECGSPAVAIAPFCLQCGAELSGDPGAVGPIDVEGAPGPSRVLVTEEPNAGQTCPLEALPVLPPMHTRQTLVPSSNGAQIPSPPRAAHKTSLQVSEERRPLVGWIYSFDFDPSGQSWILRQGRSGIGRDPLENLILLERDPSISRRHAAIICRESGVFVRDGDSQYGTRVNGQEIGLDARQLADGDQVQICGYTLTLRLL
ncbi:MAG: hypothetical protein ACI9VR_001977 [Cognaticolwellia sp.]|jgi:hypothetical protein